MGTEATPLLGYVAALLAARFVVRAAAALGALPQWVHILQDALLAALLIAAGVIAIACVAGRVKRLRISWRAMALSTAWAIISTAVLERSLWRSIVEGLILLVVLAGIGFFAKAAATPAHFAPLSSRQRVAALCCAAWAILPPQIAERPIATHHLRGLRRDTEALRTWVLAAMESGVAVDPAELASAGRALLAIQGAPAEAAWETAIDIINYRWALEPPQRATGPLASAFPRLSTWGTLQVDVRAAGKEQIIVTRARGPGAIVLDGLHISNVIFDRVPVAYDGGPIELDGVSFPRCRLYVTGTEAGRLFLEAALSGRQVHFRHSTP